MKSIDFNMNTCKPQMTYYNPIDLNRYGVVGLCPKMLYKTSSNLHLVKNKSKQCNFNQSNYKQKIDYRNNINACKTTDKLYKQIGFYDIPCLPSAYNKPEYYDLNRAMLYFFESHNN